MNTKLVNNKGITESDSKIKVTRLKELNIVNNGLHEASERLAKAYNI